MAHLGSPHLLSQLLLRVRQEDHKFKANLERTCLKIYIKGWGCSSECLPSMQKAWDSIPGTTKKMFKPGPPFLQIP